MKKYWLSVGHTFVYKAAVGAGFTAGAIFVLKLTSKMVSRDNPKD